jgi:uncharacterized protein YuzE
MSMAITLEYDPEVDGALVWFRTVERDEDKFSREVWPRELQGKIGFLLDDHGRIVGIEILSASKYIDERLLNEAANPDPDD